MAEVVNLKQFGITAKEQAAVLVGAALGATAKADVSVKVRSWIATDIEEDKGSQALLGHMHLLREVNEAIKKWMLDNNVKEIRSTDGTVKFTFQDQVYGYCAKTPEEQAELDAIRAPVQRTSMDELMKVNPELAARICNEEHRTKDPIKRSYVKCQDTRAALTEINEVCEKIVAIEECRRLYKPEPKA